MHASFNGFRVTGQAFGVGKEDCLWSENAQGLLFILLHRDELDEVVDAETAADSRCAAGRQRVIGTGYVIAHRLRRPAANEDGARVDDPAEIGSRVNGEMFWRETIGDGARFFDCGSNDHQAIAIEGNNVVDAKGEFSYLVEACDPCEANNYAYEINGVAVSDFITPHFYDASVAANVSYSYTGSIKRPRQLLPGGYISYMVSEGKWQQILWVDPGQPPQYEDPSVPPATPSLRLAIHAAMGVEANEAKRLQRHKPHGLAAAIQARVDEYAARRDNAADYERRLIERYGL